MYWQRREITRQYVVDNESSTQIIQLPTSNYLSALFLNVEATNGATAGAQTILEMIQKIEVVGNGSTELFSLTGNEAYLIALALAKRLPPINLSLAANAVQKVSLPIVFGRKIGDHEYYMDCNAYESLELRVAFAATVGATGIVDGSLKLEVLGLIAMEGAPGAFRGFLKTSRKYAFTSASSGDYVADLPRMYPYRKLAVLDIGKNVSLASHISRVTVDVNSGERVIFTGRTAGVQDASAVENFLPVIISETPATPVLSTTPAGKSVGDILLISFDVDDNMDNCLPSARYDRVTLTLSQVGAGGAIAVVLQELII